MLKNPLRLIWKRITSLKYAIRCFFFPYNVVKIDYLPRTWCDRDWVMFHAIFQILVDFVELEQPFKDWKSKNWSSRHTDREEMHSYVNSLPIEDMDWADDETKAQWERSLTEQRVVEKEILYLYEWYKDEKFDLDKKALYLATGEKHVIKDHDIKRVKTGTPQLITWNELHEIEEEHNTVCNAMLRRVLNVRECLW